MRCIPVVLVGALVSCLILCNACHPERAFSDREEQAEEQSFSQEEGRMEEGARSGGGNLTENGNSIPTTINLWSVVREMSCADYVQKYGREALSEDPVTAVAVRIGEIALDLALKEPDVIHQGSTVALELFNNEVIILSITTTVHAGDTFSFMAKNVQDSTAVLTVSITGDEVLATYKTIEENLFYLLKYNHYTNNHYLYQSPYDQIEIIEEDRVLIPPSSN